MENELEDLIQRALKLRLTLRDIANACGCPETALWRWRNGAKPNYERYRAVLAAIDKLIDDTKAYYESV